MPLYNSGIGFWPLPTGITHFTLVLEGWGMGGHGGAGNSNGAGGGGGGAGYGRSTYNINVADPSLIGFSGVYYSLGHTNDPGITFATNTIIGLRGTGVWGDILAGAGYSALDSSGSDTAGGAPGTSTGGLDTNLTGVSGQNGSGSGSDGGIGGSGAYGGAGGRGADQAFTKDGADGTLPGGGGGGGADNASNAAGIGGLPQASITFTDLTSAPTTTTTTTTADLNDYGGSGSDGWPTTTTTTTEEPTTTTTTTTTQDPLVADDCNSLSTPLCTKTLQGTIEVQAVMLGELSAGPAMLQATASADASIDVTMIPMRGLLATLDGGADLTASLSLNMKKIKVFFEGESELPARLNLDMPLPVTFDAYGAMTAKAEKFAGDFSDFQCIQKLYPTSDVAVTGYGVFVNQSGQLNNLYDSINEGVFTGDYQLNLGESTLIADDREHFIQPSSIHTNGVFRYTCNVSKPIVKIEDSRFRMRVSAPLRNLESELAPRYTFSNIKLVDPSGNLMVQYEDISLRGDADHYDPEFVNFGVYSSKPVINNVALRSWESAYPIVVAGSGYTLSFDVTGESLDESFDDGFGHGFNFNRPAYQTSASGDSLAIDGAPLATDSQGVLNPTHGVKISAIEICNSGGFGPATDQYINIFAQVRDKGFRIERKIYPHVMMPPNFNSGIFPTASSVWTNSSATNQSPSGAKLLINSLLSQNYSNFITLQSTAIADSGKLSLRFEVAQTNPVNEVTDGAFGFGFDETTYGKWTTPHGAFNTQNKNQFTDVDNFFVVESVTLNVLAKKASGSRDYSLDVVGFSDDKILNITSAVGGFLQNIDGSGTYPTASGFRNSYDTAIDEQDGFYLSSSGKNAGGDHYLLSQAPVISGLGFQWYEIPLKIYPDTKALGKSRDYSMSSMLEKLYLDIYPIPSGASISKMYLSVKYAPQNALNFTIQGGEQLRVMSVDSEDVKIFPSIMNSGEGTINHGSGYYPLSSIKNMPHGFGTPDSLKSNYARRWRGMEGTTQGPFDPREMDFGFENPLLDFPFLSGYYTFDTDNGTNIVPRVGSLTGTLSSTYSPHHFQNLGWRFKYGTIFSGQLPGWAATGVPYAQSQFTTIDWTALTSGSSTFASHPLYGRIADAFDTAVRLGPTSTINLGTPILATSPSGFSLFLRFSPDVTASGSGPWNSGVLASKWDAGKNIEFVVGYSGGYLYSTVRGSDQTLYTVRDTALYNTYQYPLNVMVTHQGGRLKLYTDNELGSNWTVLRDQTNGIVITTGNSNLMIGASTPSGVGFPMFLCEMGLSTNNLVDSNPNIANKEVTIEKFFENSRMKWWNAGEQASSDTNKLWSYVDEDTLTDWHIGDFTYSAFGPDFDRLTKRTGRDLIAFNLNHHGSGYSQVANLTIPSSVNSNVAYHTQIENDFLRFNLSNVGSRFYSLTPRITKDLPKDYKFTERGIVVETVVDYNSSGNIQWPNGQTGPKLIVSLYTPSKEPYWTPDENNWGLINRAIHFLDPSSVICRLDSTFTYDSLIDVTEDWAKFPMEPRQQEFKEKYYADDINKMFLQYDLVYPSGSPFQSRINIHSAHVRAESAFATAQNDTGSMNLVTSGGFPVMDSLNMSLEARTFATAPKFYLYTVGPTKTSNRMSLITSGAYVVPATLPLLTQASYVSSSGMNLISSGAMFHSDPSSGTLNFSLFGLGIVTSSGNGHLGMSFTAFNDQESNVPDDSSMSMFIRGDSGVRNISTNMPIYMLNDIDSNVVGDNAGTLNFSMIGSTALFSRYPHAAMNIYMFSNVPSEKMNLTLYGDNYPTQTLADSFNLYSANYHSGGSGNTATGSTYLRWFNDNYGQDISVEDNIYTTVPANDEIRGVDLIGYGSCTGDSPRKAIDAALVTHDTVWRPDTCNDGGIFRPIHTYTNTDVGYSGNFYGIRKYANLLPNIAYNVTLKVTTGSTEAIKTPREWEEWEYGTNTTINYSGAKLTSDYQNSTVSGRLPWDRYGTTTVVKGDLLAVGRPFHTIPDESNISLPSGGSVVLYRRNTDVAGEKATFSFLQDLTLPSGYKRDFVSKIIPDMLTFGDFSISGHQWNIGQEGREFGHSIDIAQSGEQEIIVVGGPGAKWTRTFDNIVTSGVPVCMIVFTDTFTYNKNQVQSVGSVANGWNVLYKYFSAPTGSFQPELDINLLIFQVTDSTQERPPVHIDETWVHHQYIDRLDDSILSGVYADAGSGNLLFNSMASGVSGLFSSIFSSKTPQIVSIFQDNSWSSSNGEATIPVVDNFINNYNTANHVPTGGYINDVRGEAESWYTDSINLLNLTLDTGNLINHNALRFITTGIGQEFAQGNAYQFQMPPSYGGRVYVFKKENDTFNLIQEIKSPDYYAGQVEVEGFTGEFKPLPTDRFGHSVAISKNTEVISIGSPFSSEPASVFELDTSEETRMLSRIYEWMAYKGIDATVPTASGQYLALSASDKFTFRTDESFWGSNTIQPYKKVYSYKPNMIGTWQFIPGTFAGTSRLGYSTAVSDDGDTIAFGAPTDSFNEFDDSNVWYKSHNTWASYTNAGAVRMFNARKYYPHNKAVEYFKFGNLDRNAHPENQQYYDQMDLVFEPSNIPFERTGFSDLTIPQDAGLAFIITPEIDAASDEVIEHIKDWMNLGDRTLVLVGNDPVYEDNGRYAKSNVIINKILKKLQSRLQIFPARNEYEALLGGYEHRPVDPATATFRSGCANATEGLFNVTPSYIPAYSTYPSVLRPNMYGYGVGDIRIDLTDYDLQETRMPSPCDELNSKCEMPLQQYGDLRAEWNNECTKTVGDQVITIKYKENWPFHFGNSNPAQGCDDYPSSPHPIINRPNQDPIPLLTAAEWLPGSSYIVPARSGINVVCVNTYKPCEPFHTDTTSTECNWDYDNFVAETTKFKISQNLTTDALEGPFYSFNPGAYIDPPAFHERNALMRAVADSRNLPPIINYFDVTDKSVLMSQEDYGTSKVILFATLFGENPESMQAGALNSDHNIPFYLNLAMGSCTAPGNIVQLGGWTGNESFADAYGPSQLAQQFHRAAFHVTLLEGGTEDDLYDITTTAWIANPQGSPSASDINKLKSWLNKGNKKLIVTYDGTDDSARNVTAICNALGLVNKPWYSDANQVYLTQTMAGNSNKINASNYEGYNRTHPQPSQIQKMDRDNPIIKGCTVNGNTEIFKVVFLNNGSPWIPINVPDISKAVIWYQDAIKDTFLTTPTTWDFNAYGEVKFDVEAGSGYRMFFDYATETDGEYYPIVARISYANESPYPTDNGHGQPSLTIGSTAIGELGHSYIDIKVPTDVSRLTVGFDTTWNRNIDGTKPLPQTVRILSVSGCLLPFECHTVFHHFDGCTPYDPPIILSTTCHDEPWYDPEYTVVIPPQFRPILTDNTKYCSGGDVACSGKGGQLIQDGPVVAAEEFENFTSFQNGSQRSRIIVLSDSSMIQGLCPSYRSDALDGNQAFIRSLYPAQPEANVGIGDSENSLGGRQFKFVQKLLSPERGSPAKFFAASGFNGLVSRFGYAGVPGNLGAYSDTENTYDPATVTREVDPKTSEEIDAQIQNFRDNVIPTFGVFPRFSGGGFVDAGIGGGIPTILAVSGHDYLEFDYVSSGYPGDLFGYSVALHGSKLVVGAPFAGYSTTGIVPWSGIVANGSGLTLGVNGGAGAAYYFQNTGSGQNVVAGFLPWEFEQKIRPSSIRPYDQFGYDVDIDADMMAVGAPNHGYASIHQHIYSGSAAFIRKEFNAEFDIPKHIITDADASGDFVRGNGAVYTQLHKVVDWPTFTKSWIDAEKITAQGFSARSGVDHFGRSVSLNRARRGDGDYTLSVGAPDHQYATSGGPTPHAGAAYVYDAMLREQLPEIPSSSTFIDASVYGNKSNVQDRLRLVVVQPTSGEPVTYVVSGLIFSNENGNIFLEASGIDLATHGFITHRPFVESVIGKAADTTLIDDYLRMTTDGAPHGVSGDMNLVLLGADSAIVYNTLNLSTAAWPVVSGGLDMTTVGASGIKASGSFNIVTSGIGSVDNNGSPLNMRIRGK